MTVPALFLRLLDIVFPLECLACGREGVYCCPNCLTRVRLREAPVPRGRTSFEAVFAASAYADPLVRRCLADWKLKHLTIARDPIQGLVWRWFDRFGNAIPRGLLVVPVPLHVTKLRERGFNQAAEIAGWLAALTETDASDVLIRVRKTEPQTETDDRAANIADAFAVRAPKKIFGRDILLVDDIWTTGATMGECAVALKNAGAGRIFGFTVAASGKKRKIDEDIHRQSLPYPIRLRNRLREAFGLDPTEDL